MIDSCPIVMFFLEQVHFLHVVKSSGYIWVGRSGCSCKLLSYCRVLSVCFVLLKWDFYPPSLYVLTQNPHPIVFNCLFCMRQPCFCNQLIMFITVPLLMYQKLSFPSSFPMLPDFFYFVFLFFINNHW